MINKPTLKQFFSNTQSAYLEDWFSRINSEQKKCQQELEQNIELFQETIDKQEQKIYHLEAELKKYKKTIIYIVVMSIIGWVL